MNCTIQAKRRSQKGPHTEHASEQWVYCNKSKEAHFKHKHAKSAPPVPNHMEFWLIIQIF